jgi:5-(carboxyamino)imidazole ribonucleotide synthase
VNKENRRDETILPGKTIGILGGGQLGRMMALDGRKMGYHFITLDPTEDSPGGQVSDMQIVGPYSSVQAAMQMARRSDVITYEFENVDAKVAQFLEERTFVPQGSQLLFTTQNRLREKAAIEAAGAPVAPYFPVTVLRDLEDAIAALGLPLIVKTTTGGYDGKGQWRVNKTSDVDELWSEMALAADVDHSDAPDRLAPLIAEKFIPFVKEISVVAARNLRGEIGTFPTAENIHVNHILHQSIVPARITPDTDNKARQMAVRIAESMDLVGLLAIEMFVLEDGQLFINELAPRPHNSGHYTMDACVTSQFEQHIRAICNLPLGDTDLLTPVVMVNVLGQHIAPVLAQLHRLPGDIKVHLYGKREAKPNRKMGHLNVLAQDVETALRRIESLNIW